MTPLKKRMLEDMRIRNYASSTERAYASEVTRFAQHYRRSPEKLGAEEIRVYLVHLVDQQKISASRFAIVSAALRFLYTVTLGQEWMAKHIPYPKRHQKLPVILSPQEVQMLVAAAKNLRDRTILAVLYGTGMRVSELVDLKVADIDSKLMVIRIRNGKGKKERQVMLSPALLVLLRRYWKAYRPANHLFLSRLGKPLGAMSVQTICRTAGQAAGIRVQVSPHILRHCFASSALDLGVDIRRLQLLLGHASIRTTAIYLHVATEQIRTTPSPYELIASAIA